MRFKSKSVLLALVAVFAVSAVAVASASATTPEFKPVPAKKKFTSTGGAAVFTDEGAGYKIECAKSAVTGEIASARTVGKVLMVFTGCDSESYTNDIGKKCPANSSGAKAGEIVGKDLSGELGTVKGATGVGLRLKEETAHEWFGIVANACAGERSVNGAAAAEFSPVGKKATTGKAVFKTSAGKQGIAEITLDSGRLEKPELLSETSGITIEAENNLVFEEALEVT